MLMVPRWDIQISISPDTSRTRCYLRSDGIRSMIAFMRLSEYGNEMRCGSIVILEGLKGEGWRHFIALLKEIVSSSFAFLDETKQFHRGLPHSSSRVGYEGILCRGFNETVKLV